MHTVLVTPSIVSKKTDFDCGKKKKKKTQAKY